MEVVDGGFDTQCEQVFRNLSAVTEAAGGSTADIVKLTIYLTDLANFPTVNAIMADLGTASAVAAFRAELSDEGIELSDEAFEELCRVREADLASAFEAVERDHPDLDAYLDALGVGAAARATLRERFLE